MPAADAATAPASGLAPLRTAWCRSPHSTISGGQRPADLRALPARLAHLPRDALLRRLGRLPELDRAEALGRLVGDPRPEAKAGRLLRRRAEVLPQLVERRLGVREAPEDEPD